MDEKPSSPMGWDPHSMRVTKTGWIDIGPETVHRIHRVPSEVRMQLTAVFLQIPEGYVAFVEELPGANT
jgi:hypothetical protein